MLTNVVSYMVVVNLPVQLCVAERLVKSRPPIPGELLPLFALFFAVFVYANARQLIRTELIPTSVQPAAAQRFTPKPLNQKPLRAAVVAAPSPSSSDCLFGRSHEGSRPCRPSGCPLVALPQGTNNQPVSARMKMKRTQNKPNQYKLVIRALHEDHFSGCLFEVTGPRVYNPDGSRKRWRRYFDTMAEAQAFLTQRVVELTNFGTAIGTLDPNSHMDAVRAIQLLKQDAPELCLYEAARLAVKIHFSIKRAPTLGALIDDLIRKKEIDVKNGRYQSGNLTHLAKRLREFADVIGTNTNIAEITSDDVRKFMQSLNKPEAALVPAWQSIRLLFNTAVQDGQLKVSPLVGLKAPKYERKTPEVLTPEQAERWLLTVLEHRPGQLAYYVLSFFAGLRSEEITRLKWDYVDLDEGCINLPAAITKTNVAREVALSPNARLWLRICNRDGVMVISKTEADARDWVRKRLLPIAGLKYWPHNSGRHSFVSYHCAYFRNDYLTASEAGHEVRILKRYYKAGVTRKDAHKYWSIVPPGSGVQSASNVIVMPAGPIDIAATGWPSLVPSA